jgi:hypothetical protein
MDEMKPDRKKRIILLAPWQCTGRSGSIKYQGHGSSETILGQLGISLIRTILSNVICDPLESFFPLHECTFASSLGSSLRISMTISGAFSSLSKPLPKSFVLTGQTSRSL